MVSFKPQSTKKIREKALLLLSIKLIDYIRFHTPVAHNKWAIKNLIANK